MWEVGAEVQARPRRLAADCERGRSRAAASTAGVVVTSIRIVRGVPSAGSSPPVDGRYVRMATASARAGGAGAAAGGAGAAGPVGAGGAGAGAAGASVRTTGGAGGSADGDGAGDGGGEGVGEGAGADGEGTGVFGGSGDGGTGAGGAGGVGGGSGGQSRPMVTDSPRASPGTATDTERIGFSGPCSVTGP